MGRGPFGIHSLASVGVQLANIGGPPPLPGWDNRRSSVATQHSTDAVIQTVPDSEWVVADRNKTSLPSLAQREKDQRLLNLLARWQAPMPLKLVSIQ
jgi:hypothetical protein